MDIFSLSISDTRGRPVMIRARPGKACRVGSVSAGRHRGLRYTCGVSSPLCALAPSPWSCALTRLSRGLGDSGSLWHPRYLDQGLTPRAGGHGSGTASSGSPDVSSSRLLRLLQIQLIPKVRNGKKQAQRGQGLAITSHGHRSHQQTFPETLSPDSHVS